MKNLILKNVVDKKGYCIFDQYFIRSKNIMLQFLIKCNKTLQFFYGILKNHHRLLNSFPRKKYFQLAD